MRMLPTTWRHWERRLHERDTPRSPSKRSSCVSRENTRLVQSAYEAFGQGDMAAFAEVMADDIEWVDPGDPDDDPNAGTFKGKEAVLGWFGGLASTLDQDPAPHGTQPGAADHRHPPTG